MKKVLITSKLTLLAGAIFLASCGNSNTPSSTGDSTVTDSTLTGDSIALKPAGPAPEWGKTIHPEMQAVIEKLVSYGDKPIESL